jgi:hypothetical protein
MRLASRLAAIAAMIFTVAGAAHAVHVGSPLAKGSFITQDGLDWAWAFPVPGSNAGFDLSHQAKYGWRLPTTEELKRAPRATDFVFEGANVPLGGTDPTTGATFRVRNGNLAGSAACAVPYFSENHSHCDWANGMGQWSSIWAGSSGTRWWTEQLVVRSFSDVAAIPLPPAALLLVAGFGLMARLKRRA